MTTKRDLAMSDLEHIAYDVPADRVARITLNRPKQRNAQGLQMLYELDAAIRYACKDQAVSVIILAASGEDFSSGHDLSFGSGYDPEQYDNVTLWGEFKAHGAEGLYGIEKEIYLDLTERWRNAPKPTIAQVQGNCIAGGNMLAWACDLIIASDDARFRDNTVDMGLCGAEFFNHPYELGVRKAKEWLFTSDVLTAQEARDVGMVNRVVSRSDLEAETLKVARKIASKPLFGLKATKEALNNAQDAMGRRQAMSTAFALHHLSHCHNLLVNGFLIDYSHFPENIRSLIDAHLEKTGGDPMNIWPESRKPGA